MAKAEPETRIASCYCGALRARVVGPPSRVNACACFECQKKSGSAFTYTAFYPEAAVSIDGEYRTFRLKNPEGRWLTWHSCPNCSVIVFSVLESMAGQIGISVGCFSDPEYRAPGGFYWSANKHGWFAVRDDIRLIERQ
jgi:hypothetical protein